MLVSCLLYACALYTKLIGIDTTYAIRDALQFKVAPDVRVLSVLLCIFSGVFILIAFGCGFVFFGTLISQ